MTTVSVSLIDSDLKATLDVEFNISLDEEPVTKAEVVGRVEMTVLKPIRIYALGAFMGVRHAIKVRLGEVNTSSKKKSKPTTRDFQTRCAAYPYPPWPEHCNIFVLASKERGREEHAAPLPFTPGTYTFQFRFDLRSMGSLNDFECKNSRGEVSLQNRIHLFIVTATLAFGKSAFYTKGHPVSLPHYAKLDLEKKTWLQPVEKSCVLRKGRGEVAEFFLKLNQQAYKFGDTIEFSVSKSESYPAIRAREVSVHLTRSITVEVEGPSRFQGVRCYREMKRILLDKKILGSKTFRTNASFWEGSLVLPEGPPHTIGTPIECTYRVELSISIFGEIQALTDSIYIETGAKVEEDEPDGPVPRCQSAYPAQSLSSLANLFGSDFNIDSISLASLPPNYSLLSSRSTSYETLPPAYGDVESTSRRLSELGIHQS